MEVLNVALGGTSSSTSPRRRQRRPPAHAWAFGDHEVRLEPGSLAARATGAERLERQVPPPQGWTGSARAEATGWSVDDRSRLVEAIELAGPSRYALGVLWHPEEDGEAP